MAPHQAHFRPDWKRAQVLAFGFICPFDTLGFASLYHVFLHLLKRPLNWDRQQQNLKKHLSLQTRKVKLETWALQWSNEVDDRHWFQILHKMVPSWHPGTGIDNSMPKEVATARLTARRIPESLLHVTRKLDPGLARTFEKLGPINSPPKIWMLPENFEATFTAVWVTNMFQVWQIWKISGSGRRSKTKISESPRFKISV